MALGDFKSQSQRAVSNYGLGTGLRLTAQKATERALSRVGMKFNYGTRPLDSEWDVMIILDACRADLFEEFAPEHPVYDRFESVSSVYSCASTSREWFSKGFGAASDADLADVHYVSENTFLDQLDLDRFYDVEKVWELEADPNTGVLNPEDVTNQALRAYHDSDAERFVVHYIPPHAPFLHCPGKYEVSDKAWGGGSHDVWFGLQVGEFDRGEVWNDYGENLLTILDEVERLVTHVSGSVAITADHANAIGEFGVYGHPEYAPVPSLKRVPWAETTGEGAPIDVDELEVAESDERASEDVVEDRLEALGYR